MAIRQIAASLGFTFALLAGAPALAHGDEHRSKKSSSKRASAEQMPFGIAGDLRRVSRTITIDMTDQMRFFPSRLELARDETIRIVAINRGKVMHELVIGTMEELQAHAVLMKKFPDMEHDAPYMAHVEPGKTEEIVWRFNRPGEYHFACLIAGHFDAGMVGTVVVR